MNKFENPTSYNPSPEEIQKAKGMITEEQKEASETRAEFKFQERDPFDDFAKEPLLAGKIQEIGESLRELTKKVAESPDKSLKQFRKIMFETFHIEDSFNGQHKKILELRQWIDDAKKHRKI